MIKIICTGKYYEIGDTYLVAPAKYKSIINTLQSALNKNSDFCDILFKLSIKQEIKGKDLNKLRKGLKICGVKRLRDTIKAIEKLQDTTILFSLVVAHVYRDSDISFIIEPGVDYGEYRTLDYCFVDFSYEINSIEKIRLLAEVKRTSSLKRLKGELSRSLSILKRVAECYNCPSIMHIHVVDEKLSECFSLLEEINVLDPLVNIIVTSGTDYRKFEKTLRMKLKDFLCSNIRL